MGRKIFGIFAFAFFFQSSLVLAERTMEVGSFPPPLKVEKWLKGNSVTRFQFGHVYVIEFWATWCVPCIQAIPHMNELAKEHSDEVTFISVAASEQGTPEEQLDSVTKFLGSADKPSFEYNVAFDSTDTMRQTWIKNGGAKGIPFVVVIDRAGQVAFKGHPNSLDRAEFGKPLNMILKGTWTGSLQEKRYLRHQELERKIHDQYQAAVKAYQAAEAKQNWFAAFHVAKRAAKLPPPYRAGFQSLEAKILISNLGGVTKGLKMLPALIEESWDSVQGLGNILDLLLHDNVPAAERDGALAKKVANRVIALIDDNKDAAAKAKFQKFRWLLLPSVVKFYLSEGNYERVIELQKQMLASLPEGDPKRESLQKDLDTYEMEHALANRSGDNIECVGGVCVVTKLFTDDCNPDLTQK